MGSTQGGGEDRKKLIKEALEHVLREYDGRGYEHWREVVGETIVIPHPSDKRVEIEISPIWDRDRDGPVRVLVSVLHTTRLGIALPGTDFLVYGDDRIDVPSLDDQP